jgi:hypothetical protein
MNIDSTIVAVGVIALILLILAIVWKPSRAAIGVVLILIGLGVTFTGVGAIVGVPMVFIGVIFLITGLQKKREPVDVRVKYEGQPQVIVSPPPLQDHGPAEVAGLQQDQRPGAVEGRIGMLTVKEHNLRSDLAALKDSGRMEGISPALIQAREEDIQKQLLEVILEKDRLFRKSQ